MREILFRGKTYSDKWVYGYLLKGSMDNDFYIQENVGGTPFWINPETVGQFTGLTDKNKNGKKIFEGDIVKFEHPAYEEEIIGVVDWEENEVGFVIRLKEEYEIIGYSSEFYQVIGNIQDNPELLGE
jgi:uncharacterized phage protein (TIGR01671 family)